MIPEIKRWLASNGSTKNLIWNLIGSLLTGVMIIIATPWYVSRLGMDCYGIIGFWSLMQLLLGLLDFGLGATIVRGFANPSLDQSNLEFRINLLRSLELVSWSIAAVFTVLLVAGSGWISQYWLQSHTLAPGYISTSIKVMAVSLGLQLPFSLYTNGLCGLQRQGMMNAIQFFGNALRYGLGIAVIAWNNDLISFFSIQIIVSIGQFLIARFAVLKLISTGNCRKAKFRIDILRMTSSFSLGMALNTIVGVLLGNMDRILLSGRLSTEELGKYSAAFTAASMLQMGIQPFYRAFFPKYSELVSIGNSDKINSEYFYSCRMMAMALIPIATIAWAFAPKIFEIWLGRQDQTLLGTFRWLVIGMTGAGLTWLPAAFQQAHGWTRLHVSMMFGALLIGTPLTIACIQFFGAEGATALWVVHGALEITLGLWLMHRKLLPGSLLEWYRSVLLPPIIIATPIVFLSWLLMPDRLNKVNIFIWLSGTGLLVFAVVMIYYKWKLSKDWTRDITTYGGL